MSVLVIPGDEGGCGLYRMMAPAMAARDVGGSDVTITPPDGIELDYVAQPTADGTWKVHTIDTSRLPAVDTIVMQRPIQDLAWQFIRLLRAEGFRIVVDVDDDFDRLHPANPAARQCADDPRYSPVNIHRAIAEADACTVSTPALAARYQRNGTPVTVLRNLVPAWYLTVPANPEPMSVGWTGSIAVHHNDLTELGGALGVLQRDGWTVKVIGRADRVALGCRNDPDVTPWMPIDRYPAEVATFGAGIVPLKPTAFNTGKSWLKGLEYAALDVPFAATPTDAYRELYSYGLGQLVEKPNRWRQTILRAAANGPTGRDLVERHGLTYQDRWRDWVTVWNG